MFKSPTKRGKRFPLTHSEGKSLNIYRGYSAVYGKGRDSGHSSYRNNQRELSPHLRCRERSPEAAVSTPMQVTGQMADCSRNPQARCRARGRWRWPLNQHIPPALLLSPPGRAQPARSGGRCGMWSQRDRVSNPGPSVPNSVLLGLSFVRWGLMEMRAFSTELGTGTQETLVWYRDNREKKQK